MKKLLVTTDFSELARHAYGAAASLARAHDATIQLVHEADALPPAYLETMSPSPDLDCYHGRLLAKLDEEVQHPAFEQVAVERHLLYAGKTSEQLFDFAKHANVDLIVMSTHGYSGLTHSLLGSFTERVARHSPVPVLAFRPATDGDDSFVPRSILVPFDFSENSKTVFPILRQLSLGADQQFKFLHVIPAASVKGEWGDVQERLRESADEAARREEELRGLCQQELPNVEVDVDSRFGDAYREILKDAESSSADLIVMATHGWTGLKRLYFGSVAEKVLRTSHCSVIVVRPQDVHEGQTPDTP